VILTAVSKLRLFRLCDTIAIYGTLRYMSLSNYMNQTIGLKAQYFFFQLINTFPYSHTSRRFISEFKEPVIGTCLQSLDSRPRLHTTARTKPLDSGQENQYRLKFFFLRTIFLYAPFRIASLYLLYLCKCTLH
jgi:hypothetical protein